MASVWVRSQIDRLLDEAGEAITGQEWVTVGDRARFVLPLDQEQPNFSLNDARSQQPFSQLVCLVLPRTTSLSELIFVPNIFANWPGRLRST